MSPLSGDRGAPAHPAGGAAAAAAALPNAGLWRSLEEYADSEGFREWLRGQHPQFAEALRLDRRGFLKYLGASMALAGASGCGHPPQSEIVPYVHAPPGQVEGQPRFFATSLTRGGYAHGVLVESNMGRPTKIEGNPGHPASLGATDIFAQAAVLQLWDPDRSQSVRQRGEISTHAVFSAALLDITQRLHGSAGAGLRILTGTVTSPTLGSQLDAVLGKFPRARWHVHASYGRANLHRGAQLAFGRQLTSRLRLERAKVILSLDGDFVADAAAGVRYSRDYAESRSLSGTPPACSRLYVIESTPSLTGAMADHRLPLDSPGIARFAVQLAKSLGVPVQAPGAPDADPQDRTGIARWREVLTGDLQRHPGASLVVVGDAQPPWMHALGHAINARLGNVGKTIDYCEVVEKQPQDAAGLTELVADIHAGSVDTLLALDVNPVYDGPADLQLADALARVPHLIHAGLYRDETAAAAEWHLPLAHPLETWSDARAYDGTASISQPLIDPLYDGFSLHGILAELLGDEVREPLALLRRYWRERLPQDAAWTAVLTRGFVADSAYPAQTAVPGDFAVPPRPAVPSVAAADAATALEILFRPDPCIGDGAWANNGWLQETPKPFSRLTWDNAALVSAALAQRLHLANGDVVELRLQERALRAPVWITPGQAAHSITLPLGYGRRLGGRIAEGLGFDAYALRTTAALWNAGGVQVRKTGERMELAGTQHHFNVEGRDLLRVGTLAQYLENPQFATAHEAFPGAPPSLYPDPDYPPGEYAWGMSIDLNACTGCNACTIACQAENNIPVVGKDQVSRGREMHWIRVDRYFEGSVENPRMYSQPVPCMMCEHAPCEVVCPVGATVHDHEGLNLQVYNRCVGTRFCSNNCPYKVRRFNFLAYVDEDAETPKAQRNPEVTVRRRGVMEKCTYCVQRIESAHISADKQQRRITDGEVVTACQAVCPTRAIRFGDTADPRSQVSEAKASPRNYVMLGELNTRPRTSYLARVRNPHPDLADDAG